MIFEGVMLSYWPDIND